MKKEKGFKVVSCVCGKCGHKYVSVSPVGVPVENLQCPKCLQQGETKEDDSE